MGKARKISLSTARRLVLASQGLDGSWRLPKGKEGAARVVENLGYVQIDTIAVVRRAHHHTFWSRRPDYTPDMLHDLQAVDRRVFEYWTHAASYVPMRDYRWYLPRMRAYADSRRTMWFFENNAAVLKEVRTRIRKEGPLGSADFRAPDGRKRGSWWDWKPAKAALETLLSMGELMVAERRNFQRIYDLTERVLPAGVDTTCPTKPEAARFRVRRVIVGRGVTDLQHWSLRDREAIDAAVAELMDAGEVTPVRIAGLDDAPHFAMTKALDTAARRRGGRRRLHILSPFDNLVIWRGPLKRLFGFDYKLECYTPEAKRKHGYFCLPILWGSDFIGRLDPKADRKTRTLIVRKLIFEPGFKAHDAVLPALAKKLAAFAAFNECDKIVVEQTTPRKTKAALRKALAGRV